MEVRIARWSEKQELRRKYWATRSSVRSFARTAHSFACSGLLASLAPSAALTRLLARSLRSLPRSWESEFLMSQNDLVLSHSALLLSSSSTLHLLLRRRRLLLSSVVVVIFCQFPLGLNGFYGQRRSGEPNSGEEAHQKERGKKKESNKKTICNEKKSLP